jgi:hypothetical protein
MRFSISGEISDLQQEDLIPDKYFKIRTQVEERLNQALTDNDYGNAIELIFLAPVILQDDNSFFARIKERKLIKHKDRTADFRLRIDYLKFACSDDAIREKLLLKNVVDAVRIIQIRLKKEFDGERLENDILTLWKIKYSDLECP